MGQELSRLSLSLNAAVGGPDVSTQSTMDGLEAKATDGGLTVIEARGTHYEVGRAIGRAMKDAILEFHAKESSVASLIHFSTLPEGRIAFQKLLAANTTMFPQYMQELRGIAAGAGVPFQVLALRMLGPEMDVLMRASKSSSSATAASDACTDVLVCQSGTRLIGHAEDGLESLRHKSAFVKATVVEQDGSEYTFTAYTYPGLLPGLAFGFNGHGVAVSVNAIFVKSLHLDGAGRYFLARHLLSSTGVEDAVSRLQAAPSAVGFAVNLASTDSSQRMVCVEMAPHPHKPVVKTVQEPLLHYNNYSLRDDVPFHDDVSSSGRQLRGSLLKPPEDIKDILEFLGDDDDSDWPIYRSSRGPDWASTVAIGVFDLAQKELLVYVDHPAATDCVPANRFSL